MIEVSYKLKEGAAPPIKTTSGAAAFDLTAYDMDPITSPLVGGFMEMMGIEIGMIYDTGVSFEIPSGYAGFLYPRSSIYKKGLILANSVGVIDSDYRGAVKFAFLYNVHRVGHHTTSVTKYEIGERIGQIIIAPILDVAMMEKSTLSPTDRGEGGFGSTGK